MMMPVPAVIGSSAERAVTRTGSDWQECREGGDTLVSRRQQYWPAGREQRLCNGLNRREYISAAGQSDDTLTHAGHQWTVSGQTDRPQAVSVSITTFHCRQLQQQPPSSLRPHTAHVYRHNKQIKDCHTITGLLQFCWSEFAPVVLVQVCLSSVGLSLLQFCWSEFAPVVLVQVCLSSAGVSLLQFCWFQFASVLLV